MARLLIPCHETVDVKQKKGMGMIDDYVCEDDDLEKQDD